MNTKPMEYSSDMLLAPADKPGPKSISATTRRQFASRDLLGGGNELHIEHNGEIYTLRQTSKGKLILTK